MYTTCTVHVDFLLLVAKENTCVFLQTLLLHIHASFENM